MILLFLLVVLLIAIPVGFLIAWLARDELIVGRKWFKALMVLALITGIILAFLQEYAIVLTCIFMFIVAFVSYRKSFDKKWTKKAFK